MNYKTNNNHIFKLWGIKEITQFKNVVVMIKQREILRTDYKKCQYPFLQFPNSELIINKLILHYLCSLNNTDFSKITQQLPFRDLKLYLLEYRLKSNYKWAGIQKVLRKSIEIHY